MESTRGRQGRRVEMKTSQKPDEFCGFQRAGVCAQRIHARKREKPRKAVPSVVVGAGAVRQRVPSHVASVLQKTQTSAYQKILQNFLKISAISAIFSGFRKMCAIFRNFSQFSSNFRSVMPCGFRGILQRRKREKLQATLFAVV